MDSVKNATATTRVSAEGQVILPKAIREKPRWTPGTELDIEETPYGVLLTPARYFPPTLLEDVAGMLRPKIRMDDPVTIEEMDAAIVARRGDVVAIDTKLAARAAENSASPSRRRCPIQILHVLRTCPGE
jgi:AbrB family looped-hinge helix DNA binding protein